MSNLNTKAVEDALIEELGLTEILAQEEELTRGVNPVSRARRRTGFVPVDTFLSVLNQEHKRSIFDSRAWT